jgi:hypothetical protein
MKKALLIIFAVFAFGIMAEAQDAIGIRVGGGTYTGTELSYQKGLGANRLELDAGANFYDHGAAFSLVGMYHWRFNIVSGLNWYIGPGAGVYMFTYDDGYYFDDDYFDLGLGGQVGIEYDFNTVGVPFLISVDVRPIWNVLHDAEHGFGWGSALGIRYTF